MSHGTTYGNGEFFPVYQYPDGRIYISDMGHESIDAAGSDGPNHEGPHGDKFMGVLYRTNEGPEMNDVYPEPAVFGHFFEFDR